MSRAALHWPVRFDATSYVVRVTTGSTTENLSITGLTVGRDYWIVGDAQIDDAAQDGDVLAILESALNSHTDAGGAVYTVGLTEDGYLSISVDSGTFQILWSHASTTFPIALLGVATSLPSPAAASFTTEKSVQGHWSPPWLPRHSPRIVRPIVAHRATLSGLVRSASFGEPAALRDLEWVLLPQADALSEYSTGTSRNGGCAEALHREAAALGRRLRYYVDRTSKTASSYTVLRSVEAPGVVPYEVDPTYLSRWSYTLRTREVA